MSIKKRNNFSLWAPDTIAENIIRDLKKFSVSIDLIKDSLGIALVKAINEKSNGEKHES